MIYKYIYCLSNYVLDLIFPRYIVCISCSKELDGDNQYSLCSDCEKKLVRVDTYPTCRICGKGLVGDSKLICESCDITRPHFDRGYSIFVYNDIAKKMIHDIKYKNIRHISYYMSLMMYDTYRGIMDYDYIAYVPLHNSKEKKRGFNQAKIVAHYLSKLSDIPLNNSLIRIKDTKEMNKLSRRLRYLNLIDAFGMDDTETRGKKILLIDDVYTTGATTNECARILKNNGSTSVDVMTFAIGISSL